MPPDSTSPDLTIHAVIDGMCIATWRNVFIDLLSKPATVNSLRAIPPVVEKFFTRHGNQCISISVLESTSLGPPPPEAKTIMDKLAKDYPNLASATVIEGTGFRLATARMLLAGIFLMRKTPIPHKVFDNLQDGARFLGSHNPHFKRPDKDVTDLLAAVEECRKKIPRGR